MCAASWPPSRRKNSPGGAANQPGERDLHRRGPDPALEARVVTVADGHLHVTRAALKEFLLHGAKYAFPPTFGASTRGLPTAYAAPPLMTLVSQPSEPPPVWPDPSGERRGIALYPLYPTVPQAARSDPRLYECLALFDALRGGAARERQLASELLSERLA